MNSDLNLETFFFAGSKKLLISVFKNDIKNKIYEDEHLLADDSLNHEDATVIFLKKNVKNIEKLTNKFVNQINLVIEDQSILPIQISIKKESFGSKITLKELRHMLSEINQQIKDNNKDKLILHTTIQKFIVDEIEFKTIGENLECNNLILVVNFVCLPKERIKKLSQYLKAHQVVINDIFSIAHIKNFFGDKLLNECQMAANIKNGANVNEVRFITKYHKKQGIFEKFFNLFN